MGAILVGVYLRQPGTQRHTRIQNTGGVTTSTYKLTNGDGCHSCRCVPAPTRDPTSRADLEHWGCDHN
ncbi:hypothetical protein EMCRGX_G032163 [Ephydatia muelleri]